MRDVLSAYWWLVIFSVVALAFVLRDLHDRWRKQPGHPHARGFRQLLVEWPSYANWVLEDLIAGSPLDPGWPGLMLGMFEAIHDFNAALAEPERVRVRGIHVNLTE